MQGDSTGVIWLATTGGVLEVSPSGVRQVPLPADATPTFGSIPGKGGGFRGFSGNAVLRILRGQAERLVLPVGLPDGGVTGTTEDQHGCLWIGTTGAGIFRYRNGKLIDRYPGMPTGRNRLLRALDDGDGNVWVATTDGLFGVCRDGKWLPQPDDAGFPGDRISAIFEDREGSLWIGTERGLHLVTRRLIRSLSTEDGLSGPEIYPMLEDGRGRVWVGTIRSGVSLLEGGRISVLDRVDGRPFKNITSFAEDRRGRILIGTQREGVIRFGEGGLVDVSDSLGILPTDTIRDFLEDGSGTMWIATDHGLVHAGREGARRFDAASGFFSDDVRKLCPASGGGFWIGCIGGLVRWREGSFSVWTETEGLASSQVRTLREDEAGRLWIGTYDRGLSCFQGGVFTTIGAAEGLGDNGVFQILDDGRGYYWFGSNRGIHRSPRVELEAFVRGEIPSVSSIRFDTRDGMRSAECNGARQPAGFRARDGRLWFPTMDGIAILDPGAVKAASVPRVVLEEVRIDNLPASGIPSPLVIDPGQIHVEIDYSAPSFVRPEQVRFRYRLVGLEENWIEAGSRRSAIYTHLSPGSYEFQAVAALSGSWSREPTRLSVVVRPPFWRRSWFLALGGVLAVAAVGGGFAWRLHWITERQKTREEFARRLLQSQETERKRIAGSLHDGIGQTLVIIKNRALLAKRHEGDVNRVLEQVQEISEAASHGLTEVREIGYALRPHHLDELGLSRAIRSLAERADAASEVRFRIDVDPIDGGVPSDVEIGLYRIVREGVNNILKHSGAPAPGSPPRRRPT